MQTLIIKKNQQYPGNYHWSGKIFSQTIFILMVSVILALVVNSLRPVGLRFFQFPTIANQDGLASADGPDGPVEISLEAALTAHASAGQSPGSVIFADARPLADYEAGHIAGARHLPVSQFNAWIDDFIATVSSDTLIITYCDGPHCPLGEALAEQLFFAGYDNVQHLHNGWTRWREAGGADSYGP